jgi:hypothetical protein
MINKIRRSPKAKSEMYVLDLPSYIWLDDYHDGKIIQSILRKFGLRVRVVEIGFDEAEGGYKFSVRAG